MIKHFIKKLIPFYTAYFRSTKSTIHNQSYWGYVKFKLTGKCNKMGGVFSDTSYLYNSQYAKNICGY